MAFLGDVANTRGVIAEVETLTKAMTGGERRSREGK
jgi:hypothetical protein